MQSDVLAIGDQALTASCYLTVDEFVRRRGDSTLLVDLRPAARFAAFHIPGSINLRPEALRTRLYLRDRDLVLVDEPFAYASVERLCGSLRARGFERVQVLRGGIDAWRGQEHALIGQATSVAATDRITPAQFARERRFRHWLVLDLSTLEVNQAATATESSLPAMPFDRRDAFEARIARMGRPESGQLTLVVSGSQSGYPLFQRLATAAGWTDVFYLEGGRQAYQRFMATQEAIHRYTPGRASAPRPCRSAG